MADAGSARSPATDRALSKLGQLQAAGSTALPELAGGRRKTCKKDKVLEHLGETCRSCDKNRGENKQKCLRKTLRWPGEVSTGHCPIATAVAAAGAVGDAGPIKRNYAGSGLSGPQNARKRPAHLRPAPLQNKPLGRDTDSAEKENRQGARKRGAPTSKGYSTQARSTKRQLRWADDKANAAAMADAEAAAAAEEELFRGTLAPTQVRARAHIRTRTGARRVHSHQHWCLSPAACITQHVSLVQVRYLGKCLGVKDDAALDLMIKMVKASARCVDGVWVGWWWWWWWCWW